MRSFTSTRLWRRRTSGSFIIVIGENNVGKSNILDGIATIKPLASGEDVHLSLSDAPDFMDYEDAKPEITLMYNGIDGKSCDVGCFLDDEGKAQFGTSLETEEKVVEVANPEKRLSDNSLKAIKEEFADKFDAYEEEINEFPRTRGGNGYANNLAALRESYNDITDYNYLTAFKLLKQHEKSEKINLTFLPINGVGKLGAQMKNKINLLKMQKDAVVLIDSDGAGDDFFNHCKDDAQIKDKIAVLQLKEFGEGFTEIESLFAPADRERHKEMIEGKSGSASSLFKRNILELSQKWRD